MAVANHVVPGPGRSLIGCGQPERLGLWRGGFLVPPLCRLAVGTPGGGLVPGRGLAVIGLRCGVLVPVLLMVPVTVPAAACLVCPRYGVIPVLARPFPLALPAGSWPLTVSRLGRVLAPALVVVPAPICAIRRRCGMIPVLARPFPLLAGSWPLTPGRITASRLGRVLVVVPAGYRSTASNLTAARIPPGKLTFHWLTAGLLTVAPVACGGLIPGGLVTARWTPDWLALARRAAAPVALCPGPVP
jgi:hypothetical protein